MPAFMVGNHRIPIPLLLQPSALAQERLGRLNGGRSSTAGASRRRHVESLGEHNPDCAESLLNAPIAHFDANSS